MAVSGKYRKKFDKEVVELMGKGYSQTGAAGHFGVTSSTLSDWCNRYPSFGESVAHGRTLRQKHYEEVGLRGMMGEIPGFSPQMWKFVCQSEFGMAERREIALEADIKQDVTVTFVTADNSEDDSE